LRIGSQKLDRRKGRVITGVELTFPPMLKVVRVGLHPEWLTIPPDGKDLYVVVDNKTMQVVASIPVGAVPKRNTSGLLRTK
jgi:hypothetical protein